MSTVDVLVAGAGPVGLATAIHARLAGLARRHRCVIELTVRMGEFVPAGGTFEARTQSA